MGAGLGLPIFRQIVEGGSLEFESQRGACVNNYLMPKMNGTQLLGRARELQPEARRARRLLQAFL